MVDTWKRITVESGIPVQAPIVDAHTERPILFPGEQYGVSVRANRRPDPSLLQHVIQLSTYFRQFWI